MVQEISPPRDLGGMIGQALGQGLQGGLNTAFQQQYQQGRLASAFNQLNPQGNFIDQLKAIAPTLLTTPGGAQALSELAPIFSTYANNSALQKALNNRRSGQNLQGGAQPGILPAVSGAPNQVQELPTETPGTKKRPEITGREKTPDATAKGEDFFRKPIAEQSPETLFPSRTVGPQPVKQLSPYEVNDMAYNIMEESSATGKPIPFAEALNIANGINENNLKYNAQLQQEKQVSDQALKELNASIISRAQNDGLLKDPEDRTVAEKLAAQGREGRNETETWEYVRTGLRDFQNAKNTIQRSASLPNQLNKVYRKLNGTYREKEDILKSFKKPIETYKKYGLFDEARRDISSSLGTNAEDTETAIFPFEGKEKKEIESFPKNAISIKPNKFVGAPFAEDLGVIFPDERFNLNPEKFSDFKENLGKFLQQNPGVNLVALRGSLNQSKRYSWTDISKAFEQLTDERRFIPDNVQNSQLSIIKAAPLPGLAQQFKYFLSETK